jgi:hypothetical protein
LYVPASSGASSAAVTPLGDEDPEVLAPPLLPVDEELHALAKVATSSPTTARPRLTDERTLMGVPFSNRRASLQRAQARAFLPDHARSVVRSRPSPERRRSSSGPSCDRQARWATFG